MWTGPPNVQKTLVDFKSFLSEFGYKRVLILGAHAEGVFVVYDSSENESGSDRNHGRVP